MSDCHAPQQFRRFFARSKKFPRNDPKPPAVSNAFIHDDQCRNSELAIGHGKGFAVHFYAAYFQLGHDFIAGMQ